MNMGEKKRKWTWGFSGGPVVENPPCNAGQASLIPGQETKIPHAAEQLSPHSTISEPKHSGAHWCALTRDSVCN